MCTRQIQHEIRFRVAVRSLHQNRTFDAIFVQNGFQIVWQKIAVKRHVVRRQPAIVTTVKFPKVLMASMIMRCPLWNIAPG